MGTFAGVVHVRPLHALKGHSLRSIAKRNRRETLNRDQDAYPVVLLLPVPFLIATAFFLVPDLITQIGLLISAGTLVALAVIVVMAKRGATSRQKLLAEAVPLLISKDMNPAFLAQPDGTVIYSNEAAEERFPNPEDDTIGTRFAKVIANPDAVLYRLQNRAVTLAAAREDIVTRTGQYRISVARVGKAMFLWRFDDLGAAPQTSAPKGTGSSLPMLTVGRSDAVLFINDAFRRLIDRRPKTLSDVFGADPLLSGSVRRIKTADGAHLDCVLAIVQSGAGRKEVYALPTAVGQIMQPPHATNPKAAWDTIEGQLPVPLMKIGLDGSVLAANRDALMMLSLDSTDGKKLGDILDGLGRPIVDWLKETYNDRSGHSSQFLRGRGEHQDTFVQVTLKTQAGEGGEGYLIAVLNDVTELKTVEAQFVQSQKMHAIGQLAGGVAHDFNNLLTAISGHCDLLLLRHDQGDQDYSDLIQIHQNANRAASLVGQLLAFSRKQNLQLEVIDLRDALSDLTHLLNRLVGEKVTLKLDHDPNLAAIRADRRQLEQVMMNLIVNGRDAMPRGGEIRVKTENVILTKEIERDRAYVPKGAYVIVTVQDEGHGISPERLPKIFDPFYTTKRPGEGTGLGLSTAYGIVKQTGGYIFADSEVGAGTVFTLMFPQFDEPVIKQAAAPAATPMPVATDDDGVVLLVEDEAPVRAFASRALRLRGYTVLEADCAEAALSMLADPDLSVDIFVTDVIMPGKDGPTWVREALIDRPETKVVFVSGYAEDAFNDGQPKIPNSVFLPKPFSLNDLTATVHGQLH